VACRKHEWKRLFTRPDDSDTERRLSYVLAGWERIFVCTSCSVVAKKTHQKGRMAILLLQEQFHEKATAWNADLKQLKENPK
jgi:predicted metal-binding protein